MNIYAHSTQFLNVRDTLCASLWSVVVCVRKHVEYSRSPLSKIGLIHSIVFSKRCFWDGFSSPVPILSASSFCFVLPQAGDAPILFYFHQLSSLLTTSFSKSPLLNCRTPIYVQDPIVSGPLLPSLYRLPLPLYDMSGRALYCLSHHFTPLGRALPRSLWGTPNCPVNIQEDLLSTLFYYLLPLLVYSAPCIQGTCVQKRQKRYKQCSFISPPERTRGGRQEGALQPPSLLLLFVTVFFKPLYSHIEKRIRSTCIL